MCTSRRQNKYCTALWQLHLPSMVQQLRSAHEKLGTKFWPSNGFLSRWDSNPCYPWYGLQKSWKTSWLLKAKEKCLCPSSICSPVYVRWSLNVAVLMPYTQVQQQTLCKLVYCGMVPNKWECHFFLCYSCFQLLSQTLFSTVQFFLVPLLSSCCLCPSIFSP